LVSLLDVKKIVIRISTLFISLLIPGSGLAALGYWKFAFLMQLILVVPLTLLCWSRAIFSPLSIQILLISVACIYVVSSILCLLLNVSVIKHKNRHILYCLSFIVIVLSGLLFGFIHKDKWLGVHVYFVPSMSMYPTLKPGQFILLDTWAYQHKSPKLNDVVVFKHEKANQWLVKRVSLWPNKQTQHNNLIYLLGDNQAASRDSRSFGGINQKQIVGKVKMVLLGIDHKHHFLKGSFLTLIE